MIPVFAYCRSRRVQVSWGPSFPHQRRKNRACPELLQTQVVVVVVVVLTVAWFQIQWMLMMMMMMMMDGLLLPIKKDIEEWATKFLFHSLAKHVASSAIFPRAPSCLTNLRVEVSCRKEIVIHLSWCSIYRAPSGLTEGVGCVASTSEWGPCCD